MKMNHWVKIYGFDENSIKLLSDYFNNRSQYTLELTKYSQLFVLFY